MQAVDLANGPLHALSLSSDLTTCLAVAAGAWTCILGLAFTWGRKLPVWAHFAIAAAWINLSMAVAWLAWPYVTLH